MRRAARVDANQKALVATLRRLGCSVQHIHTVGQGCPDILVGWRGENYLFEIKDDAKPPSACRLTADEAIWHDAWRGSVDVIYNFNDALQCMGAEPTLSERIVNGSKPNE